MMGAVALALPVGTITALNPSASAAKAPPNPISCSKFVSTMTFGTPLSTPAVATSTKLANATVFVGGSFN